MPRFVKSGDRDRAICRTDEVATTLCPFLDLFMPIIYQLWMTDVQIISDPGIRERVNSSGLL